jgi:hypothetical protein
MSFTPRRPQREWNFFSVKVLVKMSFVCSTEGKNCKSMTVPTAYERSGLECVRYNKLPTSSLYSVLSTSGVSPPSSSLTPHRKGVEADFQSVI